MSGLILLRPLWLLALLPVALAVLWLRHRRAAGEWGAIIDPALMPALRRLGLFTEAGGSRWQGLLPFATAAVLACALAGPAMWRPGAVEYQARDPVLLALDLSPSVVADDEVLTDAKAAALGVLDRAGGRPVGVMVYGADAYLAFAPTLDAGSLREVISSLNRDTLPVAGSRPDIALSMARDLFAGAEGTAALGGADLILITDGAGAGPRAGEEAARLAHDGARVWALTLPRAAPGAPAPQPGALADLAARGGGEALSTEDVTGLMARVEAGRRARLARTDQGGQALRDMGPWILPVAMLALLPLFRRRR